MKKESKQSSVDINERAFSTSTNHVMNHSLDNFPHTHLSTAKKRAYFNKYNGRYL